MGQQFRELIVIPTYNERQNVEGLIEKVLRLYDKVEILIVDDNSPDGTAEVVKRLQKTYNRLHLLLRDKKNGLGRAYLAGFKWGLERNFDVFVEMDADFSHRPEDLYQILGAIKDSDFVVGSRYIQGGGTANWGIHRRLLSRFGSIYAGFVLGFNFRDWTGGFNAWKHNVLKVIELEHVRSEGYSFQIELKYKALKKGFSGREVPILFEDRTVGQSKMSIRIMLEAFVRVWILRFS